MHGNSQLGGFESRGWLLTVPALARVKNLVDLLVSYVLHNEVDCLVVLSYFKAFYVLVCAVR